ncbi:hypothetical protein MKY96_32645 [Paenibacillus sp. FSL R7-0302]|uniref:hypothetical protein n=1 Tax=Paenibacillus sp. FSL R7-0302 TaxID=2921681 RepID=UPI0030F9BA29
MTLLTIAVSAFIARDTLRIKSDIFGAEPLLPILLFIAVGLIPFVNIVAHAIILVVVYTHVKAISVSTWVKNLLGIKKD